MTNLKLYYSITEVSQALDLPASKIRFWINALNLQIKRRESDHHGRRMRFTEKDIVTIDKVKHYKQEGYQLWKIRKLLGCK